MLTESTQNAPTFPKITSFRVDSVDVEFIRAVSVDMEPHLALTLLTGNETSSQLSHRQMLQNSNKSTNSRSESKTLKSPVIWPTYV
jgi:hypothetical protein